MKNTPHPKWTGEDPRDSGKRKEFREGEGVKDNWTRGWVAGCGTLTSSGRHRSRGVCVCGCVGGCVCVGGVPSREVLC